MQPKARRRDEKQMVEYYIIQVIRWHRFEKHKIVKAALNFIDIVFQPEGQEPTTETLDTYFMKWFTHAYWQGSQGPFSKG